MGVLAGQGDPSRSIALLWRAASATDQPAPRGPGPRPGLSVDVIVATAVTVADAQGLARLSMRAVADRLDVTSMALYTYVPSKDELIDLMYDGVHAELTDTYDLDAGWRRALETWANDLVAFYVRHPWVSHVSFARPVLGPNEQTVLENVVRILRQTGLSAEVLSRIISMVFYVARGTAQTIAESRNAVTARDASEHDWWSTRVAALHEMVPDFTARFPMSTWLATEKATRGTDASEPYLEHEINRVVTVGLAVLFDGIGAAMTREAGNARRT